MTATKSIIRIRIHEMKIVICSLFGNSIGHLERYFEQVEALAQTLWAKDKSCLSLILGYGDDEDKTGEMLFEYASAGIGARLIDVSHGGRIYPSIEHPERFRQLADAGNRLLSTIPHDADAAIWLESDLIWNPQDIADLLAHLDYIPAVAPRILHYDNPGLYPGDGPFWYDTFAFRRNGVRFGNLPPYHADLNGEIMQVDSAGSCLVMRGAIARQVRSTHEEVIYGLCRQIYERGGTIWLDPEITIYHP